MLGLRAVLAHTQERGVALGHFNVSDLVLLKAVSEAARELEVPVLSGASEGEREFVGTDQLAALVRSLREEFDLPIFLNADHTHSLSKAVEAAEPASTRLSLTFHHYPSIKTRAKPRRRSTCSRGSIHPSLWRERSVTSEVVLKSTKNPPKYPRASLLPMKRDNSLSLRESMCWPRQWAICTAC